MGFFQDLKQDLSQTVTDNMPEDMELEGDEFALSTDAAPISSEDLFGQSDSEEFKDLEAMLEEEVAALGMACETAEIKIEESVSVDSVMDAQASEEVEELLNEVEQNMAEPAYIEKAEPSYNNTSEENFIQPSVEISTDTAVITAGMTITGDISSSGNMDLIGNINGNIEILGKLNVTGSINGNSSAAEIYAESAQINGEVKSKGSVKIGQSSVVIGNIFATSAVIAGAVKGDIDVHGPVVLDTSAIVMGNIKSKSVQINNGAVIEGMCSQCYAEVSPTSFFSDVKNKKNK
ncbi:MAG: polymer-forming cytoskeletal protein [Lachnospiraceae bacterium]|nr:polymer-forming cytoskeletal protein [Lachnospiraceae bacterium]